MLWRLCVLLALLCGGCRCEPDASMTHGGGTATRLVLITLDTLRHDSFFASRGDSDMPETRGFAQAS